MVPLEAPGHSGQDPRGPSYSVHLHQDVEQGVCNWSPPEGQVQVLPAGRPTSPSSGRLLSLMWMDLKIWWQDSGSSQTTMGSNDP